LFFNRCVKNPTRCHSFKLSTYCDLSTPVDIFSQGNVTRLLYLPNLASLFYKMRINPVRKIGPGYRSITGKHPSQKSQTILQFESSLERDFLTLLEFDEEVDYYGVQPLTIFYSHNEKPARYTPDVMVYYLPDLNKKPGLFEIKYQADLLEKTDFYEAKFNAAAEYAFTNNYEFTVITEKNIRTDYLKNIKFLSRYYKNFINPTLSTIVFTSIVKNAAVTPQAVIQSLPDKEKANTLYTIWQMLARKILCCDMEKQITMSSKIWVKNA
jgi:hypothetical protein